MPSADLTAAVAITSVVFNLARFLGPAVAGMIIAVAGIPMAYAVNALAITAFLAVLSRLDIAATTEPGAGRGSLFSDLLAGLRYIGSHAGILTVLVLHGGRQYRRPPADRAAAWLRWATCSTATPARSRC